MKVRVLQWILYYGNVTFWVLAHNRHVQMTIATSEPTFKSLTTWSTPQESSIGNSSFSLKFGRNGKFHHDNIPAIVYHYFSTAVFIGTSSPQKSLFLIISTVGIIGCFLTLVVFVSCLLLCLRIRVKCTNLKKEGIYMIFIIILHVL